MTCTCGKDLLARRYHDGSSKSLLVCRSCDGLVLWPKKRRTKKIQGPQA